MASTVNQFRRTAILVVVRHRDPLLRLGVLAPLRDDDRFSVHANDTAEPVGTVADVVVADHESGMAFAAATHHEDYPPRVMIVTHRDGEADIRQALSLGEQGYLLATLHRAENVDDATWGDYVFMRKNTKGWFWEQWQHTAACRKVFAVKRNTATYEIAGTWTLAEGKALFLADMAKEQTV